MHGFDNWALSLAMFLPLAGVALMMLIPKDNELLDQADGAG